MTICNHPTKRQPVNYKQHNVEITVALEDRMRVMLDLLVLLFNIYMYERVSNELHSS